MRYVYVIMKDKVPYRTTTFKNTADQFIADQGIVQRNRYQTFKVQSLDEEIPKKHLTDSES